MAQTKHDSDLLTQEQAIILIGISKPTFWNRQGRGDIKAHVINGKRKYYKRSDVIKLGQTIHRRGAAPKPKYDVFRPSTEVLAIPELANELELAIPYDCSVEEAQIIYKRQIARLMNNFKLLPILFADLNNSDWRARHSAAKIILAKVLPDLAASNIKA